MLYTALKFYCRTALNFFFRKWQVHFSSPLPQAPTIFVANHPNAFLDAILIACSIDHKPWFLTRGEVFKKKWSSFLLGRFKMLPIYRFRDGYGTLRKNDDMINKCAELLARGNSVLIFPEGDNSYHNYLPQLQKGFLRIGEAALKSDVSLNLKIVPIGIQYSLETKGFGGTALVSFGEAISFRDFSNGKSSEEMLKLIWEKMNSLILHIEKDGYNERLNHLLGHRSLHPDLFQQLKEDQKIADSYPSVSESSQRTIRPTTILSQSNSFYFRVNHFFLKQLIESITSLIKEDQMKFSVRFAAGIFLALPIYFIQSYLIGYLTHSIELALVYFISLPASLKAYLSSRPENQK